MTLHEELGNINHLMCDKTGTLTKNELIFKSFCVDGTIFDESVTELQEFRHKEKDSLNFQNFMRCLCICHDVLILRDKDGRKNLSGASQDELVLLQMA